MCKSGSSSLYQKLHPSSRGAAVQVRRHFQQGEFPSSHHREEGWPSDQENIAQHPLFARTGWCSDRTNKEHHPGGVDKEASRHFLGDAATPPRGDARRGIRFFQNDTSKPHMFSWPLRTRVRTISSKQLGPLCLTKWAVRLSRPFRPSLQLVHDRAQTLRCCSDFLMIR